MFRLLSPPDSAENVTQFHVGSETRKRSDCADQNILRPGALPRDARTFQSAKWLLSGSLAITEIAADFVFANLLTSGKCPLEQAYRK